MPGGDRRGPMGAGPMTGRGAGFCGGFGVLRSVYRAGRGGLFGRGWGGGHGWRHMFYATGLTALQRAVMGYTGVPFGAAAEPPAMPPEQELQILKQQAETAATTLDNIRRRIDEIVGEKTQSPAEQAAQPSEPK